MVIFFIMVEKEYFETLMKVFRIYTNIFNIVLNTFGQFEPISTARNFYAENVEIALSCSERADLC